MYKKLNPVWKKFLPLLFVAFSLICFTQPLHAQPAPSYQWTVMIYTTDSVDIGEFESGDSVAVEISYELGTVSVATLISFVQNATNDDGGSPALNYALILHNTANLYGDGEGNEKLSIAEVRDALTFLQAQNGSSVNINLIGFDGGSMGMLEAAYEIKDYADVMVASEKDQPLGTWPYDDILDVLVADTEITAAQLSQVVVDKYDDVVGNAENTLSSVLLAKYSTHDLAGDWYINYLRCGSGGECEAAFGGMGIDERGNIVQWYGDEFESPEPEMPTKIDIDSNGMVTIDNGELFVGFMSPDKQTVTATISDDDGYDTAQIFVFQKRGEDVTFTTSDLAGDWDMHSFDCDSGGNCGWERGEANIASDGVMIWTSFVDSDEGEAEEELQDSYLVSINWTDEEENYWNGVVTIKEFYDEGDPIVFGAMSQSKNMIVGVIENDRNDSQIVILQKKGTGFDQPDLEGVWSMSAIGCDYIGDGIWHYIGFSVPNPALELTALEIDSSGNMSVEGEFAGALAIVTDTGIVSIEVDGEPLPFHGTMSVDRNMIVINGGGETDYQFLILQKVRETSPIEILADAISDFADVATDEEIEHDDWDVFFAAQQRAGLYPDADGNIFRDLGSFAQGVSDYAKSDTIFQSAYVMNEAFNQCIIANHGGSSEDNGLSIYFPRWFWDEVVEDNYHSENLSFLSNGELNNWDDFLDEYVYANLILDPDLTEENVTFSRSIQGGTTASAYVMISSPVWSDEIDPLLNDLGNYDTELWRAFRWDPELESYDEYPFDSGYYVVDGKLIGQEYNYMEPGYGLWFISRNDVTLDITGALEGGDYELYYEPYSISLEPGWNQIGTPFNFSVDWDMVDVEYYDEETKRYVPCNVLSDENEFTSHMLWRYSNGNYSGSTVAAVMIPGEGYWIYNPGGSVIKLEVNPVRSSISNDFVPSLERTLTLFAKASGEETPPPPPGGTDSEPDEGNGSSGSGSSKCFIATASFGSPMAGEVNILRNFRDKYLLSNQLGKVFVSLYYKYSPPIADFIAKHNFLKVAVRATLYPIVKGCGLTVEE